MGWGTLSNSVEIEAHFLACQNFEFSCIRSKLHQIKLICCSQRLFLWIDCVQHHIDIVIKLFLSDHIGRLPFFNLRLVQLYQLSIFVNLKLLLQCLTKNGFGLSNSKLLVFLKFFHNVLNLHMGLLDPHFKHIYIRLIKIF